jgi:hypothetical protein
MNTIDKRKFERAYFGCEIFYPTVIYNNVAKKFPNDKFHMSTMDISEAGISLESDFDIPEDCFVSFYLRIENNLPFKVLVKIRWKKYSNGMVLCGGEFIALKLEEIHIMRNYVNLHRHKYI